MSNALRAGTKQLARTVADAAAAAAELGAGAGAEEGPDADPPGVLALEDGVPVVGAAPGAVEGKPLGAVEGEPLGAVEGDMAAMGARAGTLLTAPADEVVPLMGPAKPVGKKPPVPV